MATERTQLQQLCVENRHRLPPGFKCTTRTELLRAALQAIGLTSVPVVALPVVPQEPVPEELPRGTTTLSELLQYVVLPRTTLVVLRRILSLSYSLQRLSSDDRFWRLHVGTQVRPRHTDSVIDMIVTAKPWRRYALMFSPKRATRVYRAGIAVDRSVTSWEPTPVPLPGPVLEVTEAVTYGVPRHLEFLTDTHQVVGYLREDTFGPAPQTLSNIAHIPPFRWGAEHLIELDGRILYKLKVILGLPPIVAVESNNDLRLSLTLFLTSAGTLYARHNLQSVVQLVVDLPPILRMGIMTNNQVRDTYTIYVIDVAGHLHHFDLVGLEVAQGIGTVHSRLSLAGLPRGIDITCYRDGAGWFDIVLLTEDGELYRRGNNRWSGFGTGISSTLTRVKGLSSVVSLELVDRRCAAVTASGELYIAGQTNSGVLGVGKLPSSKSVGWKGVPLEGVLGTSLDYWASYFLCA